MNAKKILVLVGIAVWIIALGLLLFNRNSKEKPKVKEEEIEVNLIDPEGVNQGMSGDMDKMQEDKLEENRISIEIADDDNGQEDAIHGNMERIEKYFSENMVYPEKAKKDEIQGTVVVRLEVDSKGKVIAAEIVRSLSPETDKEVLRLAYAMPKEIHGQSDGKNSNLYTIPVKFRLL